MVHYSCINLTQEEVEHMKHYFCDRCASGEFDVDSVDSDDDADYGNNNGPSKKKKRRIASKRSQTQNNAAKKNSSSAPTQSQQSETKIASKAASFSGKENLDTHLHIIEQAFCAMKRYDNRIPVIIEDGAPTHTGRGKFFEMSAYSMNKDEASEKRPTTLYEVLVVRDKVLSEAEFDSLTHREALCIALASPSVRDYLLPVERIALHKDGIVLFLPNAHPQLNAPCEKFWRCIQMKYAARAPDDRKESTLRQVLESWLHDDKVFEKASDMEKNEESNRISNFGKYTSHLEKWIYLTKRLARYLYNNPTSLTLPSEYKLLYADLNMKQPTQELDCIHHYLGEPTKPEEVRLGRLHRAVHALNNRRKVKTVENLYAADFKDYNVSV